MKDMVMDAAWVSAQSAAEERAERDRRARDCSGRVRLARRLEKARVSLGVLTLLVISASAFLWALTLALLAG